MKYRSQLLLFSALLGYSIASYSASEVSCPPESIIAQAQFNQAYKKNDHHWELYSRDITYKQNKWNVFFIVTLPKNIKTSSEALVQGQIFYDTNVKLASPTPLTDNSLPPERSYPLICSYDAGIAGYGVLAQTPPMIQR